MKKFNLFKEIIISKKIEILQAINSAKTFGIDITGQVCYEPFKDTDILIYVGKQEPQQLNALAPIKQPSLQTIFTKNYQIVEDDDRVLIKAYSNWQNIIDFNIKRASYDDTTNDGVSDFSNSDLEDIGWHGDEFNITYRELIEVLEDKCSGTLLCIEQEEPFQFSGLGFLSDNEEAKKVLFNYCKEKIIKLINEDDDYKKENLVKDEIKAAEFFEIL